MGIKCSLADIILLARGGSRGTNYPLKLCIATKLRDITIVFFTISLSDSLPKYYTKYNQSRARVCHTHLYAYLVPTWIKVIKIFDVRILKVFFRNECHMFL